MHNISFVSVFFVFLARVNNVHGQLLNPASALVALLASASTNVKVFRTSLFPNSIMDLVHVR